MVDVVMAASISDYEFSETMKSDDDEMTRRKESREVEDGELPEEGEICDEEEAEGVHGMEVTDQEDETTEAMLAVSAMQPRKPRDYDREEVVNARGAEGSMLSSWMTGIKQRTRLPNAAVASPTIDANEEYYGYGNSSPIDGTGDKDYRNRGTESTDKDYRWIREEEGHRSSGDPTNEFGDCDYRGGSPKGERRRRRSPSPVYNGSKRLRHSPPIRGGYRGRGYRGRWGERQICKFFREGYCRDGDKCSYSHDAADSGRKAELCKFYHQGFCKKGLQCPLLHGEYPCKAFHKGECSKDPCQFSHLPLTNFTQPIFDQMIKDDELASRIAVPQGPLKRRVLLPGGPCSSPTSQTPLPVIVTVGEAEGATTGGVLPPPSLVVPTLSSTSVTMSQPQLIIQPSLNSTQTTYPAFFPHHALAPPGVVDPLAITGSLPSLPIQACPRTVENTSAVVQQYTVGMEKRGVHDEEDETSFNINKMLEQITSKVKKEDTLLEESPASPPIFNPDSVESGSAPTIPETNVPIWKLHPVDDIPTPQANIDPAILQKSLMDSCLRNDPRVKKALSTQFDAFTNSLMNSAPPPLPQPSQIFMQQQIPVSTTASLTSVADAPVDGEELSASKLHDPRTVTSKDPRKRPNFTDLRTTGFSAPHVPAIDPRLSAVSPVRTSDPSRHSEQINGSQAPQMPSTSSSRIGMEQVYASSLPPHPSRDHDHRLQSSGYQDLMPSHEVDRPSERINSYQGRRASGTNWFPQAHAIDPRQVKRLPYRVDYGSQDRDEREAVNQTKCDVADPPSCSVSLIVQAPQAPLSLREKRKNNEYESPLSRIPGSTRWT